MSYDIIYARQFIKVDTNEGEQFIPFVLTGSSNVYETTYSGRERRARDWWNWRHYTGNKHYATLETMLNICENDLQEYIKQYSEYTAEEIRKRFNSFIAIQNNTQKGSSFEDWKRFFINGCKNAITVEQLVETGNYISVVTGYVYHSEEEKVMKGKDRFHKIAKTNDELLNAMKEAEEYHKDLGVGFQLKLSLFNDINAYHKLRRKLFPQKSRKNRERIPTNHYFVIHIENYGYFARKTKYGFKYSYSENGGKRYLTEKQAQRKMKDLEHKIGYQMSVKKIDTEYTVYL